MFFVSLLRILWALKQPHPTPLHPERRLETFAARTAHWLLYGSLVLAPLSGWVHHAATSGFAPIWWPLGQDLPLIPKSDALAAVTAGLHVVLTWTMAAAIAAHIAGALKHHVIDRDATLRRMLPGRPALPPLAPARHSRRPLAAALAVWIAALGIGAGLGVYAPHGPAVPTAEALAEVASEWQVEEGTLEIVVTQFGKEVTGSFADWTAAISFDETAPMGQAGSVDITISIPSLTLGSVTGQALGPDFFDAESFPTARFTGPIMVVADGYAVEGTLTIRDSAQAVRLPFAPRIEGDTATVAALLILDRRAFGIGDTMADDKTLAFDVRVRLSLLATRTP